jgi:putative acetyltransferase
MLVLLGARVRSMLIRRYTDEDAAATLSVFHRAVHGTASRDYPPEQIAEWAPDDIDLGAWAARRATATTFVAVEGERVIGFADLVGDGYVDMTFVDPDFGRRGVATTLLEAVVAAAQDRGVRRMTVHASITARPFFERHGFAVDAVHELAPDGANAINYAMSRSLD